MNAKKNCGMMSLVKWNIRPLKIILQQFIYSAETLLSQKMVQAFDMKRFTQKLV